MLCSYYCRYRNISSNVYYLYVCLIINSVPKTLTPPVKEIMIQHSQINHQEQVPPHRYHESKCLQTNPPSVEPIYRSAADNTLIACAVCRLLLPNKVHHNSRLIIGCQLTPLTGSQNTFSTDVRIMNCNNNNPRQFCAAVAPENTRPGGF